MSANHSVLWERRRFVRLDRERQRMGKASPAEICAVVSAAEGLEAGIAGLLSDRFPEHRPQRT
jgi:hypothetical protein